MLSRNGPYVRKAKLRKTNNVCRGAKAFRTVVASGIIVSESRETNRSTFTRLVSAWWRQADLSVCHRSCLSGFCSANRDRPPTDRSTDIILHHVYQDMNSPTITHYKCNKRHNYSEFQIFYAKGKSTFIDKHNAKYEYKLAPICEVNRSINLEIRSTL